MGHELDLSVARCSVYALNPLRMTVGRTAKKHSVSWCRNDPERRRIKDELLRSPVSAIRVVDYLSDIDIIGDGNVVG